MLFSSPFLMVFFSGDVNVSENIMLTVDSDLNGASPQFTLTCISSGGPATTVTWTRNSEDVPGERVTVLNDAVTAQYTHTLTVTGRLEGLYTCTVSNNKPLMASAQIPVIFQGTCRVIFPEQNTIGVLEPLISILIVALSPHLASVPEIIELTLRK